MTCKRIDRVLDLVDGFESAYALELLAKVHWVAAHEEVDGPESIVQAVRAWSPRKGRMFSPDHIRTALDTLRTRGWLAQLAIA